VFLLPGIGAFGIEDFYASFLVVLFLLLISYGRWFSPIIVIFLAVASLLQLGYTIYSGKIIDDFYWIAYFSANPDEAKSFFEALSFVEMSMYVVYLLFISVSIYLGYGAGKGELKKHSCLSFEAGVICFSIFTLLMNFAFGGASGKINKISKSYPINTATSFFAAFNVTKEILEKMPALEFQAESGADTILLILGESATKTRMQLYGYTRETTPNLNSRNDLLVYTDVLATGLNTQPNVKTLFTGKLLSGRDKVDQDIFRLAKMAGYKVYYLDNNKYQNKDPIYLISSQSDVYVSINRIGEATALSDDKIQPDEVLTVPFENVLKKKDVRKLIVMHMAGSHPSQSKRYPEAFSKFPSYYDNSILYSDYLINLWIEMLKKSSGKVQSSVAIYVSDHGVKMPPGCGFGDIPSLENINYGADDRYFTNQAVPLILWASEGFVYKNKSKYESAISNQSKRIDHRFMYSTVSELLGAKVVNSSISLFGNVMDYGIRSNTAGDDIDALIKQGLICKNEK
jgi:glucan phosphoethanolaminetransferase (alkaline phosphatase superfamily)